MPVLPSAVHPSAVPSASAVPYDFGTGLSKSLNFRCFFCVFYMGDCLNSQEKPVGLFIVCRIRQKERLRYVS